MSWSTKLMHPPPQFLLQSKLAFHLSTVMCYYLLWSLSFNSFSVLLSYLPLPNLLHSFVLGGETAVCKLAFDSQVLRLYSCLQTWLIHLNIKKTLVLFNIFESFRNGS